MTHAFKSHRMEKTLEGNLGWCQGLLRKQVEPRCLEFDSSAFLSFLSWCNGNTLVPGPSNLGSIPSERTIFGHGPMVRIPLYYQKNEFQFLVLAFCIPERYCGKRSPFVESLKRGTKSAGTRTLLNRHHTRYPSMQRRVYEMFYASAPP